MSMPKTISYMSSEGSVERIHTFLQKNPVGVLATTNPDHTPHAAVIYFSTKDDFEIVFVTKTKTQKYRNLKNHLHATLVSFDTFSQTTVQVTGKAKETTDPSERQSMIAILERLSKNANQSHIPPITKFEAGDYSVFSLKPSMIRMGVFMRPDAGGYDIFETIKFHYTLNTIPLHPIELPA